MGGGPAALSAARLSIIDVAGGHQPIAIDGGRDHRRAERRDLQLRRAARRARARAAAAFATASDTEVIAALYADEGERGVRADARHVRDRDLGRAARSSGAGAAIASARSRSTTCRPAIASLFASETEGDPRGAAADAGRSAAAPLLEFLTFGYVAGGDAIFAGMSRLPPGAMLTLDRGQAAAPRAATGRGRATPTPGFPNAEYLERLGAELDEAVRIRLRSDVPLGAFLSGGLDSAAVLALMTKHSSRPVQTFSIGFGDPDYDELAAARATARRSAPIITSGS